MYQIWAAALLIPVSGVAVNFFMNQADITREDLEVTTGTVIPLQTQGFLVDAPQMRAYFAESDGNSARLQFTYLGPTETEVALDSGEFRKQIGLKLRAPDTCNTLYVMWRIAPMEEIVVSAKRNPGEHTHKECGASGYTNIAASEFSAAVTPIEEGQARSLAAELIGNQLSVYVDTGLVWRGDIPAELLANSGRSGMRSDNATFVFTPSW